MPAILRTLPQAPPCTLRTPSLHEALEAALALALLLLVSPLLLIVALAIRLEDGGPILYRQLRVGLHGQPFMILKLRSMRRTQRPTDDRASPRARMSVSPGSVASFAARASTNCRSS